MLCAAEATLPFEPCEVQGLLQNILAQAIGTVRLGSSYLWPEFQNTASDSQQLLIIGVSARFSKSLHLRRKANPLQQHPGFICWRILSSEHHVSCLQLSPALHQRVKFTSAFRGRRSLYLGPFLAQQHNDTQKSSSGRIAKGGQATF